MRSSFSLPIKCSRRRRRLSSSSSNKTNREPSQREANAPHKNSRSAPLLLALRSAAHRTASPTQMPFFHSRGFDSSGTQCLRFPRQKKSLRRHVFSLAYAARYSCLTFGRDESSFAPRMSEKDTLQRSSNIIIIV